MDTIILRSVCVRILVRLHNRQPGRVICTTYSIYVVKEPCQKKSCVVNPKFDKIVSTSPIDSVHSWVTSIVVTCCILTPQELKARERF